MRFLICESEEGGMADEVVESYDKIMAREETERIQKWAMNANPGDVLRITNGFIICFHGEIE